MNYESSASQIWNRSISLVSNIIWPQKLMSMWYFQAQKRSQHQSSRRMRAVNSLLQVRDNQDHVIWKYDWNNVVTIWRITFKVPASVTFVILPLFFPQFPVKDIWSGTYINTCGTVIWDKTGIKLIYWGTIYSSLINRFQISGTSF